MVRAAALQRAHNGHDVLFGRVVELRAIVRRVIETAQPAKGVIAIIPEAGVLRDLLAQLDLPVKDVVEFVRLLQAAFGDQFRPPAAWRGPVLRDNGPFARGFFPRREN